MVKKVSFVKSSCQFKEFQFFSSLFFSCLWLWLLSMLHPSQPSFPFCCSPFLKGWSFLHHRYCVTATRFPSSQIPLWLELNNQTLRRCRSTRSSRLPQVFSISPTSCDSLFWARGAPMDRFRHPEKQWCFPLRYLFPIRQARAPVPQLI